MSCDKPKSTKGPVLELKADPPKNGEESNDSNDGGSKDSNASSNKINLPGPLPSIPIPKIAIPKLSIDDIVEKVHNWGEKISEEIKGRVPTLADYFVAVDSVWKELQLGDGSLYQSIVNNMQDNSKNPEIQLDATVRLVSGDQKLYSMVLAI